MRTLPLAALAAALSAASLSAADWPAWRGPDRTGVSGETGLLKTWPKAGPKLLWKTDKAGLGYAGMAVVGDTVYTMGARGKDEFVLAFDKGTEKWATPIGPVLDFKGNQWSHGPNSTPTVDGDLVFALSSKGDLICVRKSNGEKVWSLNMPNGLGGEIDTTPAGGPKKFGWGYCWSPLVAGDKLILTPGGPKGLFAAVNKNTGEILWRSKDVTDPATYSSAVAATIGGVRQYVYLTQSGVVGVAAADGAKLWEWKRDEKAPDVVAPTPIVRKDHVYVTVGYSVGATLLKITAQGKKFSHEVVWSEKQIGNKQGGVVLLGNNVFGYHEDRSWMCQDFTTGKVIWPTRRTRQKIKAGGLVAADEKLFTLDEAGTVAMLAASPKAYKLLGSFSLPQESKERKVSGKPWTHPSLSNGRLYVRDQELIYCYQIK